MSILGTRTAGLRGPIVREGDDLIGIVISSLKEAAKEGVVLKDTDIIAVTESVLAKSQGNYVTIEQVVADIRNKFDCTKPLGVVFPIMSRNRFAFLLKAFAEAAKEVIVVLNYPSDEVGNPLVTLDQLDDAEISWGKSFTEEEFRKTFPNISHPFTGVNYLDLYKAQGKNIKIIVSNKPKSVLEFTDQVIAADIHTRHRTQKLLYKCGASKVLTLSQLMDKPVDGYEKCGFNPEFGLLGSNISNADLIKLFPRYAFGFCEKLKEAIKRELGISMECLVYGDGAFKDPKQGIWELADPCVSPGHTSGLGGLGNELKLKYIADSELQGMDQEKAMAQLKQMVSVKNTKKDSEKALGTTPRYVSDLIGSLCDLMSGSGDKGTPFILIQDYFKNISVD